MRFSDGRPIFDQIAQLLEDRIAAGDLAEGERIPSVRDLAASLEANPNTAARALQTLADAGSVRCERGSGYFVAQGAAASVKEHRRVRFFSEDLPKFFTAMGGLGIGIDEVVQAWKELHK